MIIYVVIFSIPIQLLGSDRLSILAADLQVSFLLFESLREYLKFQIEYYFTKLMELVNSDSNRITYEQRELGLGKYQLVKFLLVQSNRLINCCNQTVLMIAEAIVRLWRIPGLPAELYINYDCGLYSTNLYEDLTKLLSKVSQTKILGIRINFFYCTIPFPVCH